MLQIINNYIPLNTYSIYNCNYNKLLVLLDGAGEIISSMNFYRIIDILL